MKAVGLMVLQFLDGASTNGDGQKGAPANWFFDAAISPQEIWSWNSII